MVGPDCELWRRIREFAIDDANSKLTFTARLARENGWSTAYAHRVVEEYKRFLLLAMVAGAQGDAVGRGGSGVASAPGLHAQLLGWLCDEVLGRTLHHGPTRGGSAESERYDENYRRTLASYEEQFGDKPPTDIWPPAEIRFGRGSPHVRVNSARNWVIKKRAIRNATVIGGFMCVLLVGLGAARPLAAGGDRVFAAVVAMILILLRMALVIVLLRKARGGSSGGCVGCTGCGDSSDAARPAATGATPAAAGMAAEATVAAEAVADVVAAAAEISNSSRTLTGYPVSARFD